MNLIAADRLHGSLFMSREPSISKRKQRETFKKREHHNPYAEAIKIVNIIRMKSGLRCVKRWTRQILEKSLRRMHLQIF